MRGTAAARRAARPPAAASSGSAETPPQQPAGPSGRSRRAAILCRIAELERRHQEEQASTKSEDEEKRWLYSQIEALQKRIQRLESGQASASSDEPPPCPEAAARPPPAEVGAELSRLRREMDALSSSSSDDEEEAVSGSGAGDGGGPSLQEAPLRRRRGPLMGVDEVDWADNPLWHSGPPSIGARDIGPLRLPLDDQATAGGRRLPPAEPGDASELSLSLLRLLHCSDGELMTSTLLGMSSSAESCAALRQQGGLPLVVQLIHAPQTSPPAGARPRPDKQIRSSASHALHNLVHSQGDDKRARREARVLRLLEQLRQFTEGLWQRMDEQGHGMIMDDSMDQHPVPTVVALMKLSFDEEHRSVMCQLGGLYTVAELIQTDHEAHGSATAHLTCNSTRRFAGMTLTNLTFGDGTNKALLCGLRGFMRALVAQLHSPNEDLTQVTASVLRNLSWRADTASKQTLREVGAVTALTQAAMAAQRESTLKSVLSALWNLSAHCGMNKADICEVDGALAFLVKTLTYESPSKTTAIIENGGGILRNMSSHIASREDYRQILREHNCLQTLLQQLKSSSLTIVSNACGTLWNLSARCAEDQRTLWELGAVSMLRSLIHSRHQMIAMGSSAALKNLLAARPEGVPPPENGGAPSTPGLPARRLRALQADLAAGGLTETCDDLDSAGAGRPEARFLAAGPEPAGGGRVPRSDSRDSVLSSLSDPGLERLRRRPGGGDDARLAAAVRQVALRAGVSELELRRLLRRPRADGWTGSLPRVCAEAAPRPQPGGGDRPADAAAEEEEDASDGDTVRVYTTDSSFSVISTDSSLRSLREASETRRRAAASQETPAASVSQETPGAASSQETLGPAPSQAVPAAGLDEASTAGFVTVRRDGSPGSGGGSCTDQSSGVGEYSRQMSDTTSSSAVPDSDDQSTDSPPPLRRAAPGQPPASPRQLRRLVFAGTPGRLPPSPRAPRRSASGEPAAAERSLPSPKLPRRPASHELAGSCGPAPPSPASARRPVARAATASPCQTPASPQPQRRSVSGEPARSPDPCPASPRLQRRPGSRGEARSPSLTRSSPGLPRRRPGSPQKRAADTADGTASISSPLAGKADDETGISRTESAAAARRADSARHGRQPAPPVAPPDAAQRGPHISRLAAPGSLSKGAAVCRLPTPGGQRPGRTQDSGADPAPAAAAPAADAGGRQPEPTAGDDQPAGVMIQRDKPKEGRSGRPAVSRLPQRVPSDSSPSGRPAQTWSVKHYHRRSERQADLGDAAAGDLALEDLESPAPPPHRARTARLPPEWTAASAKEALANVGQTRESARERGRPAEPRAAAGWGARLFAADGTPLSRSSSVGSIGVHSEEEPSSADDEDARLLERCIRAALPKSRSEGSCLRRPRARRRRRSPVEPGRAGSASDDEAAEAAETAESSPQPAATEPPPPPAQPVQPPPPPPATLSLSLSSERGETAAAAAPVGRPMAPRLDLSPPTAAEPEGMTTSQRVERDASVVAAALEMSRAVMAQSTELTSSLELLEGVGPPSMMDSGASINGFQSSGSLSNGRSPLLPRRPPANSRFVPELMRRALGGGGPPPCMQESAEGLSSLSSCQSNLDQVKPPSHMEEFDMENSMLSLDSLRSEVAESRGAGAENLALLEPPTLFHEVTERCDSTVEPGSESLGSDTEMCGQEELPLDPPELPLDGATPEPSPLPRRRAAREGRRSAERYRTFTRAAVSDDASSAALSELTLTPGADSAATETDETLRASAATTASARARRTCRQRRQEERERYRTQTVEGGSDLLRRPRADEPASAPARLDIRQLAREVLAAPEPAPGRVNLRQLAQEAQKAIACLHAAGRGAARRSGDGEVPLPSFPPVPPPQTRAAPPPLPPPGAEADGEPEPEREPEPEPEQEPEQEPEPEPAGDSSPVRLRPRIVKPGEETRREPLEEEPEAKGIRGKRKPLYSAPRRTDSSRREPSTPSRVPAVQRPAAKAAAAGGRSASAGAPATCPVRGTKTTQLRKVISGAAVAAGRPLSRLSRSATPSPASSATSSPQLGLRRFGSAGKAGVVSRELPRPASTPTATAAAGAAAAAAGRGAGRRPVSVPAAAPPSRLQRPAWVGAVRPTRPVTSSAARPAAAAAAAAAAPSTPESAAAPAPAPAPPAPLVKQGTFTLDEPTQEQTAAEAEAERARGQAPTPSRGGQIARALSAQLSRPPSGSRPPPKSQSGQALTTPRSRIPKSPSYESTLTLRVRCSSQSPGARRQRPASPRRGRPLRQSASNSSISGRAAARGERSASNSSVSSSASAAGRPEEATGKIAALWRRIEESRARQQPVGRDSRVWLKSPAAAAAAAPGDANANQPAESERRGPLTEGATPRSRMVFTPQGWRRLMSPAQSPTDAARPNATAVIPPFNYNPPGGGGRPAASAPGDGAEKRKRKSAALSAT